MLIRCNILFAKLLYTARYRVRCSLTLGKPEFSSNKSGLRSHYDVRAPRISPSPIFHLYGGILWSSGSSTYLAICIILGYNYPLKLYFSCFEVSLGVLNYPKKSVGESSQITIWLLSVLFPSTSLTQVRPLLHSIAPELFIIHRDPQNTRFSPWAPRVLEYLSIRISGIYPSDTSRS